MNNENKITAGKVLLALLKAGCYLLLFLGCQILVTMAVTIIFTVFSVINGGAMDQALLMEQILGYTTHITLISNLLALGILALFFLIRRKKVLGETCLVKTRPRMVAAAAALAPGLYAVVITLLGFLPEEWLSAYNEASAALNDTSIWALLATVIAAPLAEEVIFRGLIQSRLNRVMPGWLAVVVSALLFGLCHGQAVWMAYAFLLGLFFGWIALRSKSILPTVVAHMIFNAIGHFSVYLPETAPEWAFYLFTGGLLLLSVVCCLLARRGMADLFRRPAQIPNEVIDHE